jgi:hypothetical protein
VIELMLIYRYALDIHSSRSSSSIRSGITLLIKECKGFELEKEKSNTSEDFFNRSEVTFVEDGQEKTLHVLYVRYFDEIFHEFTPYKQDPIFVQKENEVNFKDIVALVCLLKNPGLRSRKRLYINSKYEFASYFQGINFNKLPEIFLAIQQKKEFELPSPLEFILQPQ